ncbi:uncharacterized protein LOC112053111 [Bicyclus anynana]|uniref:Uncharacterized protein LOC112053111 n=1 Tax=Bicyclus anynana TaxID=110368 RepID=A0A6J1NTJ6_BICAN|nr:uncharacterized protein LOC112053111 [Bicyclus anynana]
MHRYLKALFCALLVLSIVDPIKTKRSFSSGRHSYPKSGGGLSGGGHGYPSSGGSHGYPSTGGLSGHGASGGSHGYPSGGSHGYPSSGGLSGHGPPPSSGSHGYPSSGGSHGYPSSGGSHGYPSSGGSHGYPSTGGKGLSGNSPSHSSGVSHSTTVHHHYHYSPPQQIRYTPMHGGPAVNYPVYRGSPPTYVYQYKDSGSKYGTLLAGLALLNLGTLGVAGYAAAKAHSGSGSGETYKARPGEVCKFGLRKDNGDYEETRIDCNLISSFIYDEEAKQRSAGTNSTVVTTTVTNVTTINTTGTDHPPPQVSNTLYQMLPNGTLIPVNVTNSNITDSNAPASPGTMTSSVTVTTTNTTTTNALDVKGKPVEVTPGMQCYVIRNSPTSNMKKSVPCGLLQTYATQSLKKNSASRNLPVMAIISAVVAVLVIY